MFYSAIDGDFNVNARRRRRHRRAAGEGQPDPARLVPHRLGGRPDDRVARRAGRRRRLVLLDELPRPAPPVGPARVGDGPGRLARRRRCPTATRPTRPSASAILDAKPRHWRQWYDGTLVSNYEAPKHWVPATLTADQIREVNARNAVECELIDEALGRVLAAIDARGWTDDVDVIFTTDHGELQGDFGLLFKGPYHVDGLMRLPLVWRPAPSAGVAPAVVARAGRARGPRADVLRDRRRRAHRVDAGPAAARRRRRRRRPRLRARAHRVGQRAVRRRRAPAHDHPRRLGVHRVPAGLRARRHRGRALLPRRRPAPAGQPVGRPRVRVDPRRPRRRPLGQPARPTTTRGSTSKPRSSVTRRVCDPVTRVDVHAAGCGLSCADAAGGEQGDDLLLLRLRLG